MMKFKPGDKVRFLNEEGGGTVVKVLNAFMVSVAIEEGFEIPVLASEVVLIETAGAASALFRMGKDTPKANVPAAPKADVEQATLQSLPKPNILTKTPKGIYLAFSLAESRNALTAPVEVMLLNHTGLELLYTLFTYKPEGGVLGRDYASVGPFAIQTIDTIERASLPDWAEGQVQLLFFEDEMKKVPIPQQCNFRMKGQALHSEQVFHDFELLPGRKCMVFTLHDAQKPDLGAEVSALKSGQALKAEAVRFSPETGIRQHLISEKEAEVDLHISAMMEKYNHLSPFQILKKQLEYFDRMLESAIAFKIPKVVFIHGIGNGTLRQAILERAREYGFIEVAPALFAKYGNGALALSIHES